jgi:hypothetical protein
MVKSRNSIPDGNNDDARDSLWVLLDESGLFIWVVRVHAVGDWLFVSAVAQRNSLHRPIV